jgi:hypothetical protein
MGVMSRTFRWLNKQEIAPGIENHAFLAPIDIENTKDQ